MLFSKIAVAHLLNVLSDQDLVKTESRKVKSGRLSVYLTLPMPEVKSDNADIDAGIFAALISSGTDIVSADNQSTIDTRLTVLADNTAPFYVKPDYSDGFDRTAVYDLIKLANETYPAFVRDNIITFVQQEKDEQASKQASKPASKPASKQASK